MSGSSGSSLDWQPKPGDRIFRVPRIEPWRVLIPVDNETKSSQLSLRTLIYGFAGMIILGTVLLMMPFAAESGQFTSPINAFFTAASSVCVTGLTVVDTADYWNTFGEIIILLLIQFGGFGYMAVTTFFLVALGRKISIREKLLVGESIGLTQPGDVRRLVRNLVVFTLVVELLGAAILFSQFYTEYPLAEAIWKSVFHAVSAFNNAGFDLMGNYRSLSGYDSNPLILLTIAGLVIVGGLSFLVIQDIFRSRKTMRLAIDSKMVLTVSGLLLIIGTIIIIAAEFANSSTLGSLSFSGKILNSFFHNVVSRTAGFYTFDIGSMAPYALFFTMLLMFIGGASGSTAGGIKVGTFGIVFATMWSAIRGKEHPGAFGREFMESQVYRALAVVMLSVGLLVIVVFFLILIEDFEFLPLAFESVSAFGTVGLSTGITPDLSVVGKLLIALTMFIGRLGPLTLILTMVKSQKVTTIRYPKEIVRIG
jgi:trk system potassium uptake protein